MIGFGYCSICGMTHAQNHHESKTNPYAVSVTYQRFERRVPRSRARSLCFCPMGPEWSHPTDTTVSPGPDWPGSGRRRKRNREFL